jgi:Putative prokaryotic signal transducing protein
MDCNLEGESNAELVRLARFSSEEEFLVARGLLEAAGIECFCSNLYFSRMSGIYNGMWGGIAVKVRREEWADACAILNDPGKPYLVR